MIRLRADGAPLLECDQCQQLIESRAAGVVAWEPGGPPEVAGYPYLLHDHCRARFVRECGGTWESRPLGTLLDDLAALPEYTRYVPKR